MFCEFLVELTSAALGGGDSKGEGEIGLDSGDGVDELSEEAIAAMIEMLGEHDFYLQYPQLKPADEL